MTMKKKTLKKMFKYINRELFDDMLDMPEFYLYNETEMKSLFDFEFEGLCVPHKGHYLLGFKNDLTTQNYFDTLAHEMMHMHLVSECNYYGHGSPFLQLCEKGIDTFYWRIL